MRNAFAVRMRELCGNQTPSEFSRKTGLSQSAIDRYLKGERTPTGDAVVQICKSTGTSADWLLGLVDYRPTPLSVAEHTADPGAAFYAPPQKSPPPDADCPQCAKLSSQIEKLIDTVHNLSLGRSTPARTSASVPVKY